MAHPISVVIPTMNRPDSLERTLKLMAETDNPPQQIIVVDQSNDVEIRQKNEEVLNTFEVFNNKKYLYQRVPSLTKARNNGLNEALNEIVVFSDDDVDVDKSIFTNIFGIMKDKQIVMIAGIDELTQLSKTNIGYLLGTKSYRKRHIGHVTDSMLGRYPDSINETTPTEWAMGYFFVVRKSCINRWNIKWDEHLTSYAYAEDLDFSFSYSKRAKIEGLKCVLSPLVKVRHLATLEYREPSAKTLFMYIVNRKYLAHKHKMGLRSSLSRNWCEFWKFIQYVVTNNSSRIFLKAYLSKFKYSRDIISGNLDYDKFMK